MTDNEIIQAWELCMSGKEEACNDCPYFTTGCIDDLHNDTYALIKRQQAEIERLQDRLEEKQATSDKTSEWISVEDRLPLLTEEQISMGHYFGETFVPEFNVMILGATRATTLYFDGEKWYDEELIPYTVTHWMPLPEPPKGE